ncbi:MAG TPA: hypothetical protein ENI33_06060, partial [Thermoplasmatales archaeon]|nr:hypothetical protein [Thermoplasmatales archaeon]
MKKLIVVVIAGIMAFTISTANYEGNIKENIAIKDFSINERGEYSTIEIEGCNYIHNAGYPMLPYYTKVYKFPAGTKINYVEVKAKNVDSMNINKKIIPAMPPLPLNMHINEY